MAGPLDGIKVLDLSTLVQGPQAAAMLYGLGAEVIKIELPEIGDLARHILPLPDWNTAPVMVACNRGKRSVTLDLRTPPGNAALERLVETADVVMSNFRPGTLEEWGLGYDELAEINPRIIWAAASFLGPVGPDAGQEGADIAGQAYGGMVSTVGETGGRVALPGVILADHSGAQNLAMGIVAALFAREHTGRGQKVETSLLGSQIWMQANEITYCLLTGEEAGKANGGHPLVNAFYGIFDTSDGAIAVAGCPEHLWPGMCRAVERPDLLEHPRFGTYLTTPEIKAEYREVFGAIFRERTTAEWCKRLVAEGQRVAPVRGHSEVAADPQAIVNNYIVEVEHPHHGSMRVVGSPIAMSDTPTRWGTEWPELGQDTEFVLNEAGFDWDEIAALREEGAF